MELLQVLLLAVVQGITEFLPVSSQGHLVLVGKFFETDQGKLIDVALHFGSLFAVLLYFWRDMRDVIYGPFYLIGDVAARRPLRWQAKLAILLIIATIPLVIIGGSLDYVGAIDAMRTIEIIGWTTLLYGIALYVADRFSPSELEFRHWSWGAALVMGLAQALAIVPGTSRSGVTMMAGRFLGFDRREAARISLLMAVPAILAVSAKAFYDLYERQAEYGDVTLTNNAILSALLSFVTAYLALVLMMRWLSKATFTPFVIYRLILGTGLLFIAYAS